MIQRNRPLHRIGSRPRRTAPRAWRPHLLAVLAVLAVLGVMGGLSGATPVPRATSAVTTTVTPRIDLRVMLLGTSTTQPDLPAWQAALQREGVPFDTVIVSSTTSITAATLSTTAADGTPEARYEAIIASTGSLILPQSSLDAIDQYERTFAIRQVTTNVYPSASVGLNAPSFSGALDGTGGSLTAAGQAVFGYLQPTAPITMDTGTYGYEAAPLSTTNFSTLVSGPANSALVGIYTHPDGVQEMVETFDQNQYQLQSYLLRHGVIAWATRGVYFGDQRNYLETDVDDIYNADDVWDPTTHTNNYTTSVQETAADVNAAAAWSAQTGLRIDNVFNGGGSGSSDPSLLAALQSDKGDFGWINHTYDHANIDDGCATPAYIASEIGQNLTWATQTLGLTPSTAPSSPLGTINPGELVTGEHSGLANLLPGNPGTVDPPSLESVTPLTTGGTLAAGAYVYAVTDQFSATGGESSASVSGQITSTGSTGSVDVSWPAVCHAADYRIYRGVVSGTTITWTELPAYTPSAGTSFNDSGAMTLTFVDTGAAGTAVTAPPTTDTAAESGYEQNTNLPNAFAAAGIKAFGADASKPYPNPPTATFAPGTYTGTTSVAGATFADGGGQAVPRYPTNIYYNASTAAQEIDEYNWIYVVPPAGNCVATSTTTCLTTPITTITPIIDSVVSGGGGLFQHLMGNDPRPHYFHQSNLIGGSTTGLYYQVMNQLLATYKQYFNAPIQQPTMVQIANLLAQQATWSQTAGNPVPLVSGYIQGNQVTLTNAGAAISVPLSGITAVGSTYGATQSGWTTIAPGTSTFTALASWPQSRTMSVTLSPASTVADGTSTSQVTATVTDESYPIAVDQLAFAASDPAVKIGPVTSHADGTYTATVTSSTTVGPVTITATDGSVAPLIPTAQGTLTQRLGSPLAPGVTLSPSSILANGSSTTTVTATVKDAQGRAIAGDHMVISTSDGAVKIGAITDHGDGTYTATLTSSTVVHAVTVAATDTSITPAVSGQATLAQTDGPASAMALTLSSTSLPADGASTSTTLARVTDAAGHPLNGEGVSFRADDAGVRISAVTDHGNGTYTATLTTSKTAHTVAVTAVDASVSPAISAVASLRQTPLPTLIDQTNPTVKIVSGSLARQHGAAAVKLSCPTGQSYCEGTVTVTTRAHRQTLRLGSAHVHLLGGATGVTKLALSASAVRRLGKASWVNVTVTVAARNRAGRQGSSHKAMRLYLILDRTAPRVGIAAGPVRVANGAVILALSCPPDQSACRGTVALTARSAGSKKAISLGSAAFTITRDSTGMITVRLSKSVLAKLRTAAASISVRVAVSARNPTGRSGRATRTITVRLR